MSDCVYTLAVWHIALERWVAFGTSPDREKIERMWVQANFVTCMYTQIVEVRGRTDDDVCNALALLTPICRASVLQTLFELYDGIARREAGEQRLLSNENEKLVVN